MPATDVGQRDRSVHLSPTLATLLYFQTIYLRRLNKHLNISMLTDEVDLHTSVIRVCEVGIRKKNRVLPEVDILQSSVDPFFGYRLCHSQVSISSSDVWLLSRQNKEIECSNSL